MDFLSFLLYLLLLFTLIRSTLSLTAGKTKKRPGNLPPGPSPFPVVGNLFQVGKNPHRSLTDLAAVYGPLMTLKLGRVTTVVVSSADLAREVLQRHDASFSGRTFPDSVRALGHSDVSIFWIPVAPLWRSYRKVCNSNLFTNKRLDATGELRRRKVAELVAFVKDSGGAGKAVDIGQAALVTSLNLLSNTFFSVDLASLGSEKAQEFHDLVSGTTAEVGGPNIANYFPVLGKLDPQGRRRRLGMHVRKMFKVFDGFISERLMSKEAKGDVLDALLEVTEEKNVDCIDRSHIKHLLADLFVAATDTTSITLEWAMAELLHNPTIMAKAREEVDQVIGKDKPVEESDVAQLPYLQAIIKETFRMHPAAPILVPHKAEEEVEIRGYTVPKNTEIIVNAWAIGRDPNTWVNPNEFWPDRFLGSDIDVKGRNFELIPFGAGRRICPGMPLALRMVHLVLASLLQSTGWKLEEGITAEGMDMKDDFHIVLHKAQPVRAIPVLV